MSKTPEKEDKVMLVSIHYPNNPTAFAELLSEGIAELLCDIDLPSEEGNSPSDKEHAA